MKPTAPTGSESVLISFRPDGKKIRVPRGISILEAASRAGITLQSSCGSRGACGKCRLRLLSPSSPSESDLRHFNAAQLQQGWRLACQAQAEADMVVEIPASSRMIKEKISLQGLGREVEVEPNMRKVFLRLPSPSLSDQRADLARLMDALGDGISPSSNLGLLQDLPDRLRQQAFKITVVVSDSELVEAEAGDTTTQFYGMAFDIGTTTIVGYLTHLGDGGEIAVGAEINPQVQFGDDVVSRISFVSTEKEGLTLLQQKAGGAVNGIIQEVCRKGGIDASQIYELTVVGNTCMTHLFLGIDPSSLATMPYVPVNVGPRTVEAAELDLHINPRGRVHVLPNIAGFVGADTVGMILASGLEESEGLRVAVDIGTNGEVVVAKGGRLLACSTAAGPAFEGARISQGMRAASGAIDMVTLAASASGSKDAPRLQIHTINDTPPRGLCGSGLVDAAAVLRELGIITATGQMLSAESAPPSAAGFLNRLETKEGRLRFRLAEAESPAVGENIYLTSQDVRELQLAKGAICAGIMILLEEIGAGPQDVEELLLAGAFGSYIRRESALAIGLLPAIPLERIKPIGNAAGLGAKLALLSGKMRGLAKEVAGRVEYVELSERAEFHQQFADAMILEPVSKARRADR